MKISEESKAQADKLWTTLISVGAIPNVYQSSEEMQPKAKVALGQALEASWQQGFSDCETFMRLKQLRGNVTS